MEDLEADRYIAGLRAALPPGAFLVTDSGQGPWGQALLSHDHVLFADEPETLGGKNTGPSPTDLVLMALGGCTAITVRMYAARKGWTIDRIAVRLSYDTPAPNGSRRIVRLIDIDGPLDADQRARLFQIAEKCPVHRMLTEGVEIRSELTA